MPSEVQFPNVMFGASLRLQSAALATMLTLLFLIFLFSLLTLTALLAQGQTYKVIYSFTNGADGGCPVAGLTMDAAGNLYGATAGCSSIRYGTVFQLKPSGPDWLLTTLYSFAGGAEGGIPLGRVARGQDGRLYGTTSEGGTQGGWCDDTGCGGVF
jgi:hypothetical protein